MFGFRNVTALRPLILISGGSSAWPFSIQKVRFSRMAGASGHDFLMKHVTGDLFSCPSTDSLVHCVSKDLHMSKGTAVQFKKRFQGLDELKDQDKDVGDVAVLKRNERFIYYLITKPRYFDKPTYATLRASLEKMKSHVQENQVSHLSMPMIGCGLDKLDWEQVSAMLNEVFVDTAVTVTVYTL